MEDHTDILKDIRDRIRDLPQRTAEAFAVRTGVVRPVPDLGLRPRLPVEPLDQPTRRRPKFDAVQRTGPLPGGRLENSLGGLQAGLDSLKRLADALARIRVPERKEMPRSGWMVRDGKPTFIPEGGKPRTVPPTMITPVGPKGQPLIAGSEKTYPVLPPGRIQTPPPPLPSGRAGGYPLMPEQVPQREVKIVPTAIPATSQTYGVHAPHDVPMPAMAPPSAVRPVPPFATPTIPDSLVRRQSPSPAPIPAGAVRMVDRGPGGDRYPIPIEPRRPRSVPSFGIPPHHRSVQRFADSLGGSLPTGPMALPSGGGNDQLTDAAKALLDAAKEMKAAARGDSTGPQEGGRFTPSGAPPGFSPVFGSPFRSPYGGE